MYFLFANSEGRYSMKNARFWIWVNGGPVKITMKPGQDLHWYQAGPTDEGYHFESFELFHEGNMIRRLSQTGGRDCDGILEHTTEDFCSVDTLGLIGEYKFEKPGILESRYSPVPNWMVDDMRVAGEDLIGPWPVWLDPRTSVYDQYAQLANY
jgi:hypothetical protein